MQLFNHLFPAISMSLLFENHPQQRAKISFQKEPSCCKCFQWDSSVQGISLGNCHSVYISPILPQLLEQMTVGSLPRTFLEKNFSCACWSAMSLFTTSLRARSKRRKPSGQCPVSEGTPRGCNLLY